MKRRTFLKNTSVFSLPVLFGGLEVAALPSSQLASIVNGDSDKVLVLIDLNGGNDGLNTFIPLDAYDNLFNARSNVIIPQNQILGMTDTIGLHPVLGGIKNLFDEGRMTLIQGVGYNNQNRSHFRSADIWNTAVEADQYKSTGWFGRYLDDQFPGYPENYPSDDCPDPFAITMGRSISSTCQGMNSSFSMAIINPNDVGGLNAGIEAPRPDDCYGEELGYLVETFKKTNSYGERVIAAAENGDSNSSLYPDTELANQLRTIAQLISGGLRTKIFVVQLGGFDTHAEQVVAGDTTMGWHGTLLKTLSDAIYAFQQDLKLLSIQERVVGMTFSEFGRKIKSNAGVGTDHGTAAPLMVFGDCINPGVIGSNPEIADEVDIEEGVAMQYDFKSIYGSILMDWFEVPEEKINELLTEDFTYLPIVGQCASVNTYEIEDQLSANIFPNPFSNRFTIDLNVERQESVRIDLSDVMGKIVKTITNKRLSSGDHQIYVETHQLPAGVYFTRIQVGNKVKTIRIVKQ